MNRQWEHITNIEGVSLKYKCNIRELGNWDIALGALFIHWKWNLMKAFQLFYGSFLLGVIQPGISESSVCSWINK